MNVLLQAQGGSFRHLNKHNSLDFHTLPKSSELGLPNSTPNFIPCLLIRLKDVFLGNPGCILETNFTSLRVYQVKHMSLLATLVYVVDEFHFLQVKELETWARGREGKGREGFMVIAYEATLGEASEEKRLIA